MKTIRFYKTASGNSPVKEFLDSLSPKHAKKTIWVLKLIEELDTIPAVYLKKLVNTDDIWEVRIGCGRDIYRILGFMEGENFLLLNHGFQKKSQKTPLRDIKLAESRKREYLRRSFENE